MSAKVNLLYLLSERIMFSILYTHPRWYHYLALCTLAFLVRAGTFYFYVQHEEHYHQPDSNDYHLAALCIKHGYGMTYPNGRPIFWRTPGYPFYLSKFYTKNFHKGSDFKEHAEAHKQAIWVQILLCSILPLLVFQLALQLTGNLPICWLVAFLTIIHVGFILASTFLLTDALAQLLFILFLYFFYRSFQLMHEQPLQAISKHAYGTIALAALSLSAYTWMRPMGQFMAILATLLLIFSQGRWKTVFKKISIFLLLFIGTIFPWFYRNYQLTGSWFFCPLFGLYFNAFNAPKILARTENIPLADAHKKLSQAAGQATAREINRLKTEDSSKVVCGENVCMQTAWPVIREHPLYFMYDWLVESIKTAFDLYSSQLVAFAGNCFKWDPLVEYLDEKIALCLYKQPMPISMRVIAWLELFLTIIIWSGILAGIFNFILKPLISKNYQLLATYGALWLKTGIFIAAVCLQTGGFGYARLRLPIEPLMLILGIAFWHWFFHRKK